MEWNATVEIHPRWSAQPVYYNPNNPSDSLLKPGIDGVDLLLLLFALPLNILTFATWFATIASLREKSSSRLAGGVRILKRPEETRVPLPELSALGAGFYGMAAASFIAAFPVVIGSGFQPTPRTMGATWTFVLAAGVVVFVLRGIRNRSGIYDLRLNRATQTIMLPKTAGRPEPLKMALREISGVSMQRRVSKGPSGTHFSYLPALNSIGPDAQSRCLALTTLGWSEEKAQSFSRWLSEELGVEFRGVEEENAECAVKS
jgi:hypothetical protein